MIFTKNKPHLASAGDYPDVRNLWDVTFEEDSKAWRDWYFKNIHRPQNCFILRQGGRIISMSHINPYPMMLNGKRIQSAALAGVATVEEERGHGYAALLIKQCLKEMRKRGQALSFLYPFNYDFYRKYGYELCYENDIYTLSESTGTDIDVTEMDEKEDAADLYEEFSVPFNGYIMREAQYQRIKLDECLSDGGKAYIFTRGTKKLGYALTEDQGDKIHVGELIMRDAKGAAGALYEKLGKSIEFMSPYPIDGMQDEIKPHCMARITDIEGVFDGTKAKEHRAVIKVTDDIIKENNGVFDFDSRGGTLRITRTKEQAQEELSIKDLAAIALGYEKSMSAQAMKIYSAFFGKKRPWIVEVC